MGILTTRRERLKVIRKAQKRLPWISQAIDSASVALDLSPHIKITNKRSRGNRCHYCKGSRLLCGKSSCPLLARIYAYLNSRHLFDKEEISGNSPPGVFVGRIGYPYVYAGPMVPPVFGNTEVMDLPELWFGKSMKEIIDLRSMMVRGKIRVDVRTPEDGGRMLDDTRELTLSRNSTETDLVLANKPHRTFILSSQVQPMGPSARIKKMRVESNVKTDRRIEKAYYDSDLKASDAVRTVYDDGVAVSKIQRAFSMGIFGVKGQRRLVPTRWSITAVDSLLSQNMMSEIKDFPAINEFRLYESSYLDNRFEILMMPEAWKYESMEAWYPGTIWNPTVKQVFMLADWEPYQGRTAYAGIGGCYYAARLAVSEKLREERRQAAVLVLREAHPGYIMPVGVWQVRENARNALRNKPLIFNRLGDAIARIGERLDIDLKVWMEHSQLLKDALTQTKITSFF